ncbi:aspartate kinase, partial [Cesiribacter andamanensis]|uniref:aspartate kinase n=1 Tax=Cesiribacter andamanensis TaxID=649507 RepID=UPI00058E7DE6
MKVMKFGGSSVGSAEAIARVLELVARQQQEGNSLALVCSAMSGVTDGLLRMLAAAVAGQPVQEELNQLQNRHYAVVRELLEVKRHNPALLSLKIYFNELEALFAGIQALGEVSARTSDRVLSYGELCSNVLMAHLVDQQCGRGVFADARQLIKTNAQYGKALVNPGLSRQLIRSFFLQHAGSIPVITGFIAATEGGDTTTLGRGGSDYTAALIGAAIEAEEIQIWTDVDGFMTADPRLVKKAFSLDQLSYNEAIELSYFGAKVIYPPTMLPAIDKGIPIRIKNTFNPACAGTLIGPTSGTGGSLIRGISSIAEISLLNVQGSGMVGQAGFSGRLFSALARKEVNVVLITQASSEHSITFAIRPQDVAPARQAIEGEFEFELLSGKLDAPQLQEGCSIVAAVGENMKQARGLAGKLFSALGRSGVNIIAIAQGSSELNISLVIRQEDLRKALNSVHDSLFLSPVKTLHVFCCGTGTIG